MSKQQGGETPDASTPLPLTLPIHVTPYTSSSLVSGMETHLDPPSLKSWDVEFYYAALEALRDELICSTCLNRGMRGGGFTKAFEKALQIYCPRCKRTLGISRYCPFFAANFNRLLTSKTMGDFFKQYLPNSIGSIQPKWQAAIDNPPMSIEAQNFKVEESPEWPYRFDRLFVKGIPRCHLWRLWRRIANYGISPGWVKKIRFLNDDGGAAVTELFVYTNRVQTITDILHWYSTEDASGLRILPSYTPLVSLSPSEAAIAMLENLFRHSAYSSRLHHVSGRKEAFFISDVKKRITTSLLAIWKKIPPGNYIHYMATGTGVRTIDKPDHPQTMITLCIWNCQSLSRKEEYIEAFLKESSIDILFTCETRRSPHSLTKMKNCLHSSPFPSPHASGSRYSNGVALHSKWDAPKMDILYEDPGLILIFEAFNMVIFCAYLPPSLKRPARLGKLFGEHANVFWSSTKPRVLMGDLNIRLGTITGDSVVTGIHLHKALVKRGLRLQNRFTLPPTFVNHNGTSTPDLIYCSRDLIRSAHSIAVDMDTELGMSDHRPLLLTLDSTLINSHVPQCSVRN